MATPVYSPMTTEFHPKENWVLPPLRPIAFSCLPSRSRMPRRLVRGLRPQEEQPSDLEAEASNLACVKKRKHKALEADSGYQTEESSYEDQSESRRLRPRRGSVNYDSLTPTSTIWSLSPTSPIKQKFPDQPQLPPKPQFRGHTLVLCFKDTDLPDISEEICEAFRAIQCSVETIYMDSEAFETAFRQFLNMESSQPRIIYIISHGLGTAQDKLDICSHGDEHDGYTFPWSQIQHPIDRAQCDILTILTCCHGGLAKISTSTPHAKELITTASWSESTFAYIGHAAMKIALDRWYWASADLTGFSLYDILTRVIKEIREGEIRKGHERVGLLEDRCNSLEYDISRLERELNGLRGSTPPPPAYRATASKRMKTRESPSSRLEEVDRSGRINKQAKSPDAREVRDRKTLEALIKTQQRLLKDAEDEKKEEEDLLEEDKKYFTQPHFMRAQGRMSDVSRGSSHNWRL